MNVPFISICIPAYQRAGRLRRLLNSISIQIFRDFEVIISDDSPDDSVKKLADEYSGSLPISYSKNDPAAGTPGNWNTTLLMSKGIWIKMMHDDDWFSTKTALQQFAQAARQTSSGFIFTAYNDIYHCGKEVNEFLGKREKDELMEHPFSLFFRNVIGHPSTVMHRRDDEILYDTGFKWVVDIDFYIRYLLRYPGFVYIPEMLVNIGRDDSQVSYQLHKNPNVEVPEYMAMMAKYPPGLMMEQEQVFHCAWDLVRRFRIGHIKMIEGFGYKGPIPPGIQSIIEHQKHIPWLIIKQSSWSKRLMKNFYRKLKAQGL